MGLTGEEVGYRDAIRQVERSLQRRLRTLEEKLSEADGDVAQERLSAKVEEVKHLLQVVESLHR